MEVRKKNAFKKKSGETDVKNGQKKSEITLDS